MDRVCVFKKISLRPAFAPHSLTTSEGYEERGYFIRSVSALEVLLAGIERNDNTGKEVHREILQNLVSGYEAKSKYADYFKGFGFQTNFYSRSRVISKMDKLSIGLLPGKDKNAVLLSGMADAQSINIIDNLSYQLIK